MKRKKFMPTQEQIKEACEEIRKRWDDAEHIARMTGLTKHELRANYWTPPVMPLPPGCIVEIVSDIDIND